MIDGLLFDKDAPRNRTTLCRAFIARAAILIGNQGDRDRLDYLAILHGAVGMDRGRIGADGIGGIFDRT